MATEYSGIEPVGRLPAVEATLTTRPQPRSAIAGTVASISSFGEWGFILASRRPYRLPAALPGGLRFLSPADLPLLFNFPLDMARVPTEVNRLSNQVLVQTFEEEWGKVHQ